MGFGILTTSTSDIDELTASLLAVAMNFTDEHNKALANTPLARQIFNPEDEPEKWLSLFIKRVASLAVTISINSHLQK